MHDEDEGMCVCVSVMKEGGERAAAASISTIHSSSAPLPALAQFIICVCAGVGGQHLGLRNLEEQQHRLSPSPPLILSSFSVCVACVW